MIVGIGCDIVNHQMTNQLNWVDQPRAMARIFSVNEIELYNQKKEIKFLAGRFAAKEAVLKSIGTGMEDGIALTEIEILQLNNGKPFVKLEGNAKKAADKAGVKSIHISISHSADYSIAYSIADNNKVV